LNQHHHDNDQRWCSAYQIKHAAPEERLLTTIPESEAVSRSTWDNV